MARDLALLRPEILVLLAGAGALVFEMLRRPRLALATAVAGLLAATAWSLPLLGAHTEVFGGTLRIDALGVWAKLILLPATVLALLLSRAELRGSDREGTVYSLLCFTAFGALVLAGSGDTMLLVLGLVLTGLGSFALVAYPRDNRATEAAMKFYVFASVTGAVMIFGLSYWFGATGSTLLGDLSRLQDEPLAAALGLVALVVGLGYEASLAPFHFWAPDAYDGAPVSVAAYLSVVPKLGALFALAQVVGDLPGDGGWRELLAAVAVLTMTWAYLAALVQHNVMRLLAYSSIAQAGYLLLGILAIGASPLALPAIVVFAAAYAAMNLGAFAVTQRTGRTLDAFTGVGRSHVPTGVAMVVFLLSLTGVPPLAGFAGKVLLFAAAMDAHYTWLAVIAILNTVLSLAVYLRLIVPLYGPRAVAAEVVGGAGAGPERGRSGRAPADWVAVVGVVAFIATVVIGVAAQWLLAGVG